MKKEQSSQQKLTRKDRKKTKEEQKLEEEEEEEISVRLFGKNMNLLQIIKGNGYYLLNRDKFDITKIMMMIDYHKLSLLGEAFRTYVSKDGQDGMIKSDFIDMIYNQLKEEIKENEKTDLVYGIHKFFCEIDFNGDLHMEWAEFTQFIIDKVEGEFSNIEKEEDVKERINSEKAIIKYKRYELSQNIIDYNIHKSDINATSYMNKINRLLISEYNGHIIKMYNPLTGRVENTIDIHKINDDIEKVKIEELLRNEKNANQIMSETNKAKLQKVTKSNSLNKLLGQNYVRKKLQEQKTFGKNYSIINFTVYGNVIAVTLSSKQIQFFTTVNTMKGELLYEFNTKALQKRVWFLENHNMWLSSGDKEYDEDYYYINELDIEFQLKSGFPVPISKNMGYRKKFCRLCPHKSEIYDIIETKKPFLIITACLDGLIRLIDVSDSEFIKVWKYHNLGVKHLDYNPNLEFNGYIISTGFEYFINIYNTDLSIDDAYKGRLEGHFVPVINCRFICGSPICVSVDEEGNARLWDILLRTCLQSIPISKKNFTVNGLLMMNRVNKFIVYGNSMLFYDSKYKDKKEDKNDTREDINYPIKISFNKYYQHFYVTTNKDIRIFNKNGILEKTFRKCIENENFEIGTKIKNFIFEDNHRKFYLSFSNGAIMQYNAGNGSLIKAINQYEIEKEGITYFRYQHTKDVSSLFFFHQKRNLERDNLLLISCSFDSTIQVYNEYNLESTSKLRTIKGGHNIGEKKCEILCMDFSVNLCQLATGSSDGLITIWDFEYSKIQEILYFNYKMWGVKLDVICVRYLNDYPLLFSSYSEGICALWGVYPLDKSIKLILKFHNFYQTMIKLDLCDVLCCHFIEGMLNEVEEKFLNKKYFVDTPEYIEERNIKRFDPATGDELPLIKRDDIEKEAFIDKTLDPTLYEEEIFHKYDNETARKIKLDTLKMEDTQYLVLGDKKGYIKILNLKGVFGKYKNVLNRPQNYHVTGSNFNLLKKDDTNVESFLAHLIHGSSDQQKKFYNQLFNNIYANNIINREWRGHLDAINDVTFIEDPKSIVTISNDMYLRVWDELFNLIGEINIFPNETNNKYFKTNLVPWTFKVNEKKIIEKEINEVVDIFESVGIKKIIFDSDEDKKNSNLKIMEKEEKIKKTKENAENDEEKKKREIRKKYEIKKDEFEFTTGYELVFLKNLTTNIEFLLQNKLAKEGMGEISNNLMSTMINQKNKMFYKKKKEKQNSLKGKKKLIKNQSLKYNHNLNSNSSTAKRKVTSFLINESDNDNKSVNLENEIKKSESHSIFSKFKLGSTFSPSKLGNLILNLNKNENNKDNNSKEEISKINKITEEKDTETNLNNQNDIISSNNENKIETNNFLKINKRKFDNTFKSPKSNNKNFFSVQKKSIINSTNENINNNNLLSSTLSQRPFSQRKALKRNLSSDVMNIRSSHRKKMVRPSTGKESHMFALNYIPHNINRNNLYSEKFFSRLNSNSALRRDNLFPNIKEKLAEAGEKMNFLNFNVKEKTENLVKTQFYLNSYKNCCKILPNNSLSTNTSIILNYKNMWNNVKLYTNNIKDKNRHSALDRSSVPAKKTLVRSSSVKAMAKKNKMI